MQYKSLILLLVILFYGCMNKNSHSDAFGNFEAETLIISSESSGKILQLNVKKGDKTEAGSMTAIIDTLQISLKLKQIEAQKEAIEAGKENIRAQIAVFEEQKKNLQTNEKRVTQMVADEAATQKQLDDITGQINVINKQIESTETQFISINKELKVLESQRKITEDLFQRCIIISPVTGTILETYAEQGELTTHGKPLFKIANTDELTLKVYVSGAQLPNIKIAQTAEVLADKNETENYSFTGKVTWISPEAEFTPKIIQTKEERVKLVYAVKLSVKNDGTLKIGMPGEVRWQ